MRKSGRTGFRTERRRWDPQRVPLCLAVVLFLIAASSAAQENPATLDLYLLAGQSNMAGRGQVAPEDTVRHPRVFALSDSMTWRPAYEPIHFDKPDIVGVGPGFAFGKALATMDTSRVIGLIPAAVGGSPIETWKPGAVHLQTKTRPYDDAVSRTFRVLALHGGTLRGIIWHQGEANSKSSPEEYAAALDQLVERFRGDFEITDLPFVAAPLAPFFTDRVPSALAINGVIMNLPDRVPKTAVVRTDDLTSKDDNVHLDAASARVLGRRYAEAISLLNK